MGKKNTRSLWQAQPAAIIAALVLMAKPANTFRDTRAMAVAEIVYRVGDGCGVEVIPAADRAAANHESGAEAALNWVIVRSWRTTLTTSPTGSVRAS